MVGHRFRQGIKKVEGRGGINDGASVGDRGMG